LIDAVEPGDRNATVVLANGKISAIDETDGHKPLSNGAQVIDLAGSYVLPGLWDAHTHLESSVRPRPLNPTVPETTLRFASDARRALIDGGIVGMRTGGLPFFIDVAIRDAIAAGLLVGPRILAAGHFLTTTAGHLAHSTWTRECDGPFGFVEAIRDQIKNGVDHIKFNLSGGIMGPVWDQISNSYWLGEELAAAFEICALRGFNVMAHATNPESVKAALRHGAHTVEHGYRMDEECIDLFLETDTWYVPTLCISQLTPGQAVSPWEKRWVQEHALRSDLVERAEAAAEEHRRWFQRALRTGVRMALGSDAYPTHQAVFQEMELWVKHGASPWQTILAATKNGAELCGVGQETGTVEVGKTADLIVVRDNPLTDINNIRALEMVFRGGDLVADHRGMG
jgi:imidazolonepropionase-like amidohydrolase